MGYLTGGHPENDQALTRPQYVPRQIRKKKWICIILVEFLQQSLTEQPQTLP